MTVEYKVGTIEGDDFGGADRFELSSDAHMLFQILLETNAKCTEDGKPRMREDGMIESFLLPLHSLFGRDCGLLKKDLGCIVCGNPTKDRCSRCQVASYCGIGAFFKHRLSKLVLITSTGMCSLSTLSLEGTQKIMHFPR